MTYIAETTEGYIVEVTNFYNCLGQETIAVEEARACVIRLPDGGYREFDVDDIYIHRVQ